MDQFARIPFEYFSDKNMTLSSLGVWGFIAFKCNGNGYCNVMDKNIAEALHMPIRTVKNAINHLEKHGHIVRRSEGRRRVITMPNRGNVLPLSDTDRGNVLPSIGATACPSLGQRIALPSEKNTEKKIEKNNTVSVSVSRPRKTAARKAFERLWSAWPMSPNKTNEFTAWTEFQKAYKEMPNIEELISFIEKLKKTELWLRDNGRYIKSPANWLKGKCWLDSLHAESLIKTRAAPPPGWVDDGNGNLSQIEDF